MSLEGRDAAGNAAIHRTTRRMFLTLKGAGGGGGGGEGADADSVGRCERPAAIVASLSVYPSDTRLSMTSTCDGSQLFVLPTHAADDDAVSTTMAQNARAASDERCRLSCTSEECEWEAMRRAKTRKAEHLCTRVRSMHAPGYDTARQENTAQKSLESFVSLSQSKKTRKTNKTKIIKNYSRRRYLESLLPRTLAVKILSSPFAMASRPF